MISYRGELWVCIEEKVNFRKKSARRIWSHKKNDTCLNKSKKKVSELCGTFSEIPAMKAGWVILVIKDPSKIFPEFSFLFFDLAAKESGKDQAQCMTWIITNRKNTFLAKKKKQKQKGTVVGKA